MIKNKEKHINELKKLMHSSNSVTARRALAAGIAALEDSIEWHDLRKNPKDLPSEDDVYMTVIQSPYGFKQIMSLPYTQGHWNCSVEPNGKLVTKYEMCNVIAWTNEESFWR